MGLWVYKNFKIIHMELWFLSNRNFLSSINKLNILPFKPIAFLCKKRKHSSLKTQEIIAKLNLSTTVWCCNYADVVHFILIRFCFVCNDKQFIHSDDIRKTKASCAVSLHAVLVCSELQALFYLRRKIFASIRLLKNEARKLSNWKM